jgi:hypothetical protein
MQQTYLVSLVLPDSSISPPEKLSYFLDISRIGKGKNPMMSFCQDVSASAATHHP